MSRNLSIMFNILKLGFNHFIKVDSAKIKYSKKALLFNATYRDKRR